MKGIFHKRVPSFSFTTFNWSKDDKDENRHGSRSQPSTPFRADFDLSSRPSPDSPSIDPDSAQVLPASPTRAVSTDVSPPQPPQSNSNASGPKLAVIHKRRSRAGSLVDSTSVQRALAKLPEFPNHLHGRRGSANDAFQAMLASSASIASPRHVWSSTHTNHFSHHRKRFSSLFGGHRSPQVSRPSSPGASSASVGSVNMESLHGYDSDGRSVGEVTPANAFDQNLDSDSDSSCSEGSGKSSEDEDDDLLDYINDETIVANTTANASALTPIQFLQSSDQPVPFIDSAPNLTSPPPTPIPFSSLNLRQESPAKMVYRKSSVTSRAPSLRRRKSNHSQQAHAKLPLVVSRPIYEKNRCTITIEHGDIAKDIRKPRRTRFYIVASDLSEDSKYAIEWTIGTVLRQGDECLIITIIETETKFDPEGIASTADKLAKIKHQKDRQEKAIFLVREATSLLERTALNVKVTCQAVHGKNAKHMLVDCIDFLKPNLVIVGRHGMSSSQSHLMGSACQYLVEKSSVPVMVARRTLRVQPKVYKKKSQLDRSARMRLDQATIDKKKPQTSEINNQSNTTKESELSLTLKSTSSSTMHDHKNEEQNQVEESS